jgi:ATP-dependent DNA helicase PIF1
LILHIRYKIDLLHSADQQYKMNLTDQLNEGQKAAYNAVVRGEHVFITGPGGTGKSFLMNCLFETLPRQTGRNVALTALTGCAALLLHPRAKTLHSWAGVGLARDCVPILVKNIKKSRRAALRWLQTDVLVIDEVSMMTPEFLEKLDEVGRKVRRNDFLPFGGLQLVFVGDFYQLPPIAKSDDGTPCETKFAFESSLWKKVNPKIYELTEIVRQKDPVFQEVLNEARKGEVSKKALRILSKRMDLDYSKEEIKPTMLFTRRAEVDDINFSYLKKLTTERKSYKAKTIFLPTANNQGLTEHDPFIQKAISKMDYDAPYNPDLVVAVGAQVMLIYNLEPESGLVNGSRGVVVGYGSLKEEPTDALEPKAPKRHSTIEDKDIDNELLVPVVKFKNGQQRAIGHTSWELPDFPGISRAQIPLKLAYAVTIHKSQGSTLDCALVDVGENTFEYGQAYVALSRVKDMDSLYIHDLSASAFKAHDKVKEFYSTNK